jgi:hypothetical protein
MARLGEVSKLPSIAATQEMMARARQRVQELMQDLPVCTSETFAFVVTETVCKALAEDEDLNRRIGSAVAHMSHVEQNEENLARRDALHFYEQRFGVVNPLDGMQFIDTVEPVIANAICMMTSCEPSVAGNCANELLSPGGPVMMEITKWRIAAHRQEMLNALNAQALERVRVILGGVETAARIGGVDWLKRLQEAVET